MIRTNQGGIGLHSRIPRESGDDPYLPSYSQSEVMYSPRERG